MFIILVKIEKNNSLEGLFIIYKLFTFYHIQSKSKWLQKDHLDAGNVAFVFLPRRPDALYDIANAAHAITVIRAVCVPIQPTTPTIPTIPTKSNIGTRTRTNKEIVSLFIGHSPQARGHLAGLPIVEKWITLG